MVQYISTPSQFFGHMLCYPKSSSIKIKPVNTCILLVRTRGPIKCTRQRHEIYPLLLKKAMQIVKASLLYPRVMWPQAYFPVIPFNSAFFFL
jgi:hypothetical protein